MSEKIVEYIVELLEKKQAIPDTVDVTTYKFLEEGHIDSMGILRFVFDLEETYGISFAEEDILSKEFGVVNTLANLISEKVQRKAS